MKVVITDEAAADLERIGDFIARDNPRRAMTFVAEIVARCERLADAPKAFPLVPRYEHAGIRRQPYEGYLIFYRIGTTQIEVLHVFGGAQDYEPLLVPNA